MNDIAALSRRVTEECEKIIVGKRDVIRLIVMAVLADGHVLLDDLPGVGKTTLVKTLTRALGCDSRRVQFVPDLLPADILGMKIYDQKAGDFRTVQGPVVTNLLLADEINRAMPRTQAALLEAMEERQISIDGETTALPRPFLVLATQNPVESESTFRLPAAQMDRFLVCLSMGYPQPEEERQMLASLGDRIPFETVETVTDAGELLRMQEESAGVFVSQPMMDYIVSLCHATREQPAVKVGVSPRGTRSLFRAAKVWAAMEGRSFVLPEDVQTLAVPVLAHRLVLTGEARFSGKTAAGILEEIVAAVPVPPLPGDLIP